jgi:D-beta-D-heptose 7-phosphate kinase/D-beta-D-heptose 1-phosphate adenosyltransferase
MLDAYLMGSSTRLTQEAPVPVVEVDRTEYAPGGAANVAVNISALGARPCVLSVVGRDAEAQLLAHALEGLGVPAGSLIQRPDRRTLAKSRVLADGHMLLRMDEGSTGRLPAPAEEALVHLLRTRWTDCNGVVVSDYGYGVMTPGVISALADLQRAHPRVLVVDAKDVRRYRNVGATAAKPNFGHAAELLRSAELMSTTLDHRVDRRAERLGTQGERLLEVTGAQIVAVTIDSDGAMVFERDRPSYRTYARPTRPVKTSGAGDTFGAALCLALAAGAPTPAAAELASAAAGVVVGKDRTSVCSADELRHLISGAGKIATSLGQLSEWVDVHRRQGRRVVFTNGCFDILHRGHVTYLSRAKSMGDVLIVGMNDDAGVRQIKGQGRPINPLDDRMEVLAALSCVDHVAPFAEPTPERMIGAVRPDVFVKGGDYSVDMLPEAALVERLGGTVHILPYVEDRSTTGVIDRIRTLEPTPDRAAVLG